jgi:hypothetical protein
MCGKADQPVSEELFELNIPEGTRIRNVIPGKEAVFRLGQVVNVNQVDAVLAAVRNNRGLGEVAADGTKDRVLNLRNTLILANLLVVAGVATVTLIRK